MKKALLLTVLLTSYAIAQSNWSLVWRLEQKPFLEPQTGSEMAIVKAGFDTDEDGWGEFLCAWTDKGADNYLLMYEATGDNTYELVWYFNYPVLANTFAGIAVGDIDNNGIVDIVTTMPSVVDANNPNPPRMWIFEWSGVQGENKYGRYTGDDFVPTYDWNFGLPENYDFRPYSLIIEDIDKDGSNELIVGVRQSNPSSLRQIYVCSATGSLSGFGSMQVEWNYANTFGGSLYSVTTGDLDNDGNNEIYALVWDLFTMRIFECLGDSQYEEVFAVDKLYNTEGIDFGAVDGVRVADVNNDGVNEMYIAGTEPQNTLFIVTGISDVSQMTADDIQVLLTIPGINVSKFRAMYIADPDHDGNLSLMIAGEGNGQIFEVEYKGEGDPADSESWDVRVLFDVWEYSGIAPTDDPTLTPRFFYGHPANDMDNDGKDEYLFVNYSTDFNVWENDAYVWMIEIDEGTDVENVTNIIPHKIELMQNYPNPFNPATKIQFKLNEESNVKLVLHDVLGREVAVLLNSNMPAGIHTYNLDAANYPSGVYYYTMHTNNTVQTRKMMLVK